MTAFQRVFNPFRQPWMPMALRCDGIAWGLFFGFATLLVVFRVDLFDGRQPPSALSILVPALFFLLVKAIGVVLLSFPRYQGTAERASSALRPAVFGFLTAASGMIPVAYLNIESGRFPFWQGPRVWLGAIAFLLWLYLLTQCYHLLADRALRRHQT